jgi:hypothetical protein
MAKRRADQQLPVPGSVAADYGAQPLHARKGRLERVVDGAKVTVQYADPRNPGAKRVKVMEQCVVDALFARGALTWRQWKAADKLRRAFHASGFDTLRTAKFERSGGGDLQGVGMGSKVAREEYVRAIEDLGKTGHAVVWWIVLSNYSAADFAHRFNLGRDGGMGPLRLTLDTLADHYKLPKEEHEKE